MSINTIDMINALNAITFDVVLEISRLKRKIMIRGINNIPIFISFILLDFIF